MATSENMRLYDIATRLQVFTEGVKVQYAREFNFVLSELRTELNDLLWRIKYKTLDGLTKAELNKLVVSLRESQSKIYSNYTQQILKQLKDFMAADLETNRRSYVFAKMEFDESILKPEIPSDSKAIRYMKEENSQASVIPLFGLAAVTGNNERLWSAVTNAPIPANGLYLVPFVKTFAISAQASVENTIRKAWANGWTVEETLAELTGEDNKQGTSSQLQRIGVQANAVISTAVQHVAGITGAAVMSALYGWYRWYSVMDGKTTEVCKGRNGNRYRFGQGPIPPAHINCRSHIAPIVGNDDIAAETFYTWAIRQPTTVQSEIFTQSEIDDLESGDLNASEMPKFQSKQPLTPDEFKGKINKVLSR